MKKHRKSRRSRVQTFGPIRRLVVEMTAPEIDSIEQAAYLINDMTVAAWVRATLVPIALNAIAEQAERSNKHEFVNKIDRLVFQRFDAHP